MPKAEPAIIREPLELICIYISYYVYMYIHIIFCLHVYICIYTERERESKKMQRWTTSDVKKIENVIKTFRSETFSY